MTIALPDYVSIDTVGRFGAAPALVLDDRIVTYAELDQLIERRCSILGRTRRVVMIEMATTLEPIITYLAALRGGHVALLTPANPTASGWDRVTAEYRPDITLRERGGDWTLIHNAHNAQLVPDLHPDLAVLLGTSGSTGSPRMVRLSHENLRSNAAAIAGYLNLDSDSRAATTLPLHYCYGLSVLNSHLLAGGSLWLTDSSVADSEFWDDFVRAEATSIAGVPYTYELLERSKRDWLATPGLRQVTQAGGRMSPDRVRDLAVRAESLGVEFFVMYGQTEATARMAFLPPHLAATRPATIGSPIEGGTLSIIDGELVYRGANVMMGYASSLADLARGHDHIELHTGDLGIEHEDGLFEITGRANRMAKIFGTRLDLDLVESTLMNTGFDAHVTVVNDVLRIHTTRHLSGSHLRRIAIDLGLPPTAVAIDVLSHVPLTSNGKVNYVQLTERRVIPARSTTVLEAYSSVFGNRAMPKESFTSLAGNSLSYVELYSHLQRILGTVPATWPSMTIGDLSALAPAPATAGRQRWFRWMDTPIAIRAIAIILIVGTHADLWSLRGSAHALLAVFGFNLARFTLTQRTIRDRWRSIGRTVRDLAIPCVFWAAGVALITDQYRWTTVLMMTNIFGDESQWALWFIEDVIWTTIAFAIFLSIPAAHRGYQHNQFAIAVTAFVITMALHTCVDVGDGAARLFALSSTMWLVALGWMIGTAKSTLHRSLLSAVTIATTWGWFENHTRDTITITGILLLIWIPRLPIPKLLAPGVTLLAAASMFVYVTTFQVEPPLTAAGHPWMALLASAAVGIAVFLGYLRIRSVVSTLATPNRQPTRSLSQ